MKPGAPLDPLLEPAGRGPTRTWKLPLVGLSAIVLLFLALRGPVMYRQPGGYDEDFYAVPGLAILQSGIPQLPHVPARNSESVFIHADTALYSEPPLYFYFQAVFYWLLPDVYGTARLASGVAALAIVACVYRLSLAAGAGATAALASAALFSLSRWFYFPTLCARPDTLCVLFGFMAILALLRWRRDQRMTSLLMMGACLGLGGLTHFLAIIYAIQIGLVVACSSRGWGRLANPGVLAASAIVVFCAWLPLIAIAPDVFAAQLGNQLGEHTGGSIWQRLLMPQASFEYQLPVTWEHIGPIQWVIPGTAMLYGGYRGIAGANRVLALASGLGVSGMYLICVFVGPDHPVYGYWVYPAGLMFVCLAYGLENLTRRVVQGSRWGLGDAAMRVRAQAIVCAGLAIAVGLSFVPGCGLRTWLVHVSRWNDVNYDSPRFARMLMDSLTADEVCAVDAQFVLDFVAAGRPTLLANDSPPYFRVDQMNFDRLIVSRHAMDKQLAQRMGAKLVRTAGVEEDEFACYAEIYDPPNRAPVAEPTAN